jgi:hypothetical protein
VLEDKVVARVPAAPGYDVGIVPVDDDVGRSVDERGGEELAWPVDAIACGPCLGRVAVQAVDEDNVDGRVGVAMDEIRPIAEKLRRVGLLGC